MLLSESVYDIKELIFDKPELVAAAKKCFINARVASHALNVYRHNDISCNILPHKMAIDILLPKENKLYLEYIDKYQDAIKRAFESGNRALGYKLKAERREFANIKSIPAQKQRTEEAKTLYPYALQNDGKIACIYVVPGTSEKIRVILSLKDNMIISVFMFRSFDFDSRIISQESIELLLLKVYGTLDVPPAKIYKAIKDYECSLLNNVKKERLMAKFFKSQNIATQVKQQAIRKYEEELRSNA